MGPADVYFIDLRSENGDSHLKKRLNTKSCGICILVRAAY
jgi:hypothetical protein